MMSKIPSLQQLNDKLKGLRLEAGNPEHIQLRDAFEVAMMASGIKKEVTECPECGYRSIELYDLDLNNNTATWQADTNCHPDFMTDLEGNFIDYL